MKLRCQLYNTDVMHSEGGSRRSVADSSRCGRHLTFTAPVARTEYSHYPGSWTPRLGRQPNRKSKVDPATVSAKRAFDDLNSVRTALLNQAGWD